MEAVRGIGGLDLPPRVSFGFAADHDLKAHTVGGSKREDAIRELLHAALCRCRRAPVVSPLPAGAASLAAPFRMVAEPQCRAVE